MRTWVAAAVALVHPDSPLRAKMDAMRRLTTVVCAFSPLLELLALFVSPDAHEACLAVTDLVTCIIGSNVLLRCDALLRDVSVRIALDALDIRRTASLRAEYAQHDSLLSSMHMLVAEVTAPLSVIAGLSDKLLSDAVADELAGPQRAVNTSPRASRTAPLTPRLSTAPRLSVPRTSLTTQQRANLSLAVIKDSARRVTAEFSALVGAVAVSEAPSLNRYTPAPLQQLLEQCAATYALLMRPGVSLVVNASAELLCVANGALVEVCLHAALQLANLFVFSGSVILSTEPHAPHAVLVHVMCEHAQLSAASEDGFDVGVDYLARLAESLGGHASHTLSSGGALGLSLLLPLYDPASGSQVPRLDPQPQRRDASPVKRVARSSITSAATGLTSVSSLSGRHDVAENRPSFDVDRRPRLLCFQINDAALNAALRANFVLVCAYTEAEVQTHICAAVARPFSAVLVSCSLDSSAGAANAEMLACISRIHAANALLPILATVSGGAETLVTSAAVATAIAAATALAAAVAPEALTTLELAAELLVKSSQLVRCASVLASTATVLQVQPDPAVLQQLQTIAAPSAANVATLLPVIASAPALASAVTQSALKATEELSDALCRAFLRAGAAKCFIVPLIRSELADRIATYLKTLELAAIAETNAALLGKLLPERVSSRLKAGQAFCAEAMPSVTILFCDVCQFTVIAGLLDPIQIIVLLNELFSAFDALMEKYGVFKVETIGDCFMCVAGHDGAPHHAARMLALAGEMLEVRTRAKLPCLPPADLSGVRRDVCQDFARGTVRVRIGLHSGSAVAGVVGGLMPRYCFFGDAVVRNRRACVWRHVLFTAVARA